MLKRRLVIGFIIAGVLLVIGLLYWHYQSHYYYSYPGEAALVGTGDGIPASEDLDKDIQLMWRTVPNPGEKWTTAATESVDAAERIFNKLKLVGMTREEVANALRFELRDEKYGYYFTFWPVPKGTQIIRIDTGAYGWQFNVYYNSADQVEKIERMWIE